MDHRGCSKHVQLHLPGSAKWRWIRHHPQRQAVGWKSWFFRRSRILPGSKWPDSLPTGRHCRELVSEKALNVVDEVRSFSLSQKNAQMAGELVGAQAAIIGRAVGSGSHCIGWSAPGSGWSALGHCRAYLWSIHIARYRPPRSLTALKGRCPRGSCRGYPKMFAGIIPDKLQCGSSIPAACRNSSTLRKNQDFLIRSSTSIFNPKTINMKLFLDSAITRGDCPCSRGLGYGWPDNQSQTCHGFRQTLSHCHCRDRRIGAWYRQTGKRRGQSSLY